MLDLKIQMYQKLIARKVLCFSHSKVSKLDSINSRTVSINSQTASDVSKLDSRPRSSKFSRIEDRESSFEYRASRDCQLTFVFLSGTVCFLTKISSSYLPLVTYLFLKRCREFQALNVTFYAFSEQVDHFKISFNVFLKVSVDAHPFM